VHLWSLFVFRTDVGSRGHSGPYCVYVFEGNSRSSQRRPRDNLLSKWQSDCLSVCALLDSRMMYMVGVAVVWRHCDWQVDAAIDACSQLINLRDVITDSKHLFDQYVAIGNNQVRHAYMYSSMLSFVPYCSGKQMIVLLTSQQLINSVWNLTTGRVIADPHPVCLSVRPSVSLCVCLRACLIVSRCIYISDGLWTTDMLCTRPAIFLPHLLQRLSSHCGQICTLADVPLCIDECKNVVYHTG